MASITDIFPDLDQEEMYQRFLSDLGAPPGGGDWNTRPGSMIYNLFMALTIAVLRAREEGREAVRQSFLTFATEDFLELRAAELGLTRAVASPATVTLTFTGTPGTVVPSGAQFATEGDPTTGEPGITFSTYTEATLPETAEAIADTPGARGNVGAATVVLIVDAPDAVTAVTNVDAASGGADEQSDEALRAVAMEVARTLPESGNANTYRVLARVESEVAAVQVFDLWEGQGTVLIVLATDVSDTAVTPGAVERLQESFDPSIKVLAHGEDEAWTGSGFTLNYNPCEGAGAVGHAPSASGTSTATLALSPTLNLSEWDDAADEVWVRLRRDSAAGNLSGMTLQFRSGSGNTATATISAATINGLADITTSTGDILKIARSSFTTAGTFSWGAIDQITETVTATASGAAALAVDTIRIRRAAGGFLTGLVPIGIQATVMSAKLSEIDVAANVTLMGGVVAADVEAAVASGLRQLFASKLPGDVIRIADVANVIHDTRGVVDHSSVTLNGGTSNVLLSQVERATLGDLTLTAV